MKGGVPLSDSVRAGQETRFSAVHLPNRSDRSSVCSQTQCCLSWCVWHGEGLSNWEADTSIPTFWAVDNILGSHLTFGSHVLGSQVSSL